MDLKQEATQAQDGPWLPEEAAGGKGEGRVSSSSTFSPAPLLHKGPLSEHRGTLEGGLPRCLATGPGFITLGLQAK